MLLGTPDYLSPEQARDAHTADIRADIYSLGCVLYHALAGQPPFPDTNIISQMIRHATEVPRPLKAFNPAVPDGLQQIVNLMLAKDPAQRYPTPERAAQALQVFLTAGKEPAHAEVNPHLRSYLTWLESEDSQTVTPPAPAPAAAKTTPAAAMAGPSAPALPALPTESSKAASSAEVRSKASPGKRRSKKHKRHRQRPASGIQTNPPVGIPTGAPVGTPSNALDVELIPTEPHPTDRTVSSTRSGVSRRDFLVFAIGAGSVLFAVFVGWLAAYLKARKPATSSEEESEPEPQ
jgi:serine/threonine protein kinase